MFIDMFIGCMPGGNAPGMPGGNARGMPGANGRRMPGGPIANPPRGPGGPNRFAGGGGSTSSGIASSPGLMVQASMMVSNSARKAASFAIPSSGIDWILRTWFLKSVKAERISWPTRCFRARRWFEPRSMFAGRPTRTRANVAWNRSEFSTCWAERTL